MSETESLNAPEHPQRRVTSREKKLLWARFQVFEQQPSSRRSGAADILAKICFSRQKIKH
jgi:hypothetical protein